MPRYFFAIENGQRYTDIDGLEFDDLNEVRREATGLAVNVMRMVPERDDWLGWSVRVRDERGGFVLSIAFVDTAWPNVASSNGPH